MTARIKEGRWCDTNVVETGYTEPDGSEVIIKFQKPEHAEWLVGIINGAKGVLVERITFKQPITMHAGDELTFTREAGKLIKIELNMARLPIPIGFTVER